MSLRRIGLTGASGMLGRHIVARLAVEGIDCCATSRTKPAASLARWTPWDLREDRPAAIFDIMFPGVDVLIHAGAASPAAEQSCEPRAWFDANVRACLCLGDWAAQRGIPVVYISGAIVYADADGGTRKSEDAPLIEPEHASPYGLSKLMGEQTLRGLACTTVLRASSIYGAGQASQKLVSALLIKAERGDTLRLTPPVDDRFNLIHADDVASAALAAARAGATGVFNVGAPAGTTLLELANTCVAVRGCGRVAVDEVGAGRPAIHRYNIDCSKAHAAFGFVPRVPLHDGLARTMRGECLSIDARSAQQGAA